MWNLILIAIVIYFVGKFVIRKLIGGLSKIKGLEKVDPTVRNYIMNFAKAAKIEPAAAPVKVNK